MRIAWSRVLSPLGKTVFFLVWERSDPTLLSRRPLLQYTMPSGFGKDGKGVIIRETRSQALGTLANAAVILLGTKLAIVEDFRMIKSEILLTISGTQADEKPILVGIANGNLSVGEIAEALAVDGPLGPTEAIEGERVMRGVWIIGSTHGESAADSDFTWNDKKGGTTHVLSIPTAWTFSNADGWNFWIMNDSGAILTTGADVRLRAKHFGVWVV